MLTALSKVPLICHQDFFYGQNDRVAKYDFLRDRQGLQE